MGDDMKAWARLFYQSTAWKKCRASYIVKVYGLCERCGDPGQIVHHQIWLTPSNINDPDVSLNHDHLEYVCLDCHNRIHHKKYSATRNDMTFDDQGNLVHSPPSKTLMWRGWKPMDRLNFNAQQIFT